MLLIIGSLLVSEEEEEGQENATSVKEYLISLKIIEFWKEIEIFAFPMSLHTSLEASLPFLRCP